MQNEDCQAAFEEGRIGERRSVHEANASYALHRRRDTMVVVVVFAQSTRRTAY